VTSVRDQRRQGAADRLLPSYDVRTSHALEIDAPTDVTYRAARELDMGKSVPAAILFAIRTIPHVLTGKTRPTRSLTLQMVLDAGFTILEERPPEELVIGVAGKFWRPDSGLLRVARGDFTSFDEPGYAKATLSFTVEEHGAGSLLATETRVACTDDSARRKFLLYWRVIAPFSGFIRRSMLKGVKRAAEATWSSRHRDGSTSRTASY
jgi:hypothetical protein